MRVVLDGLKSGADQLEVLLISAECRIGGLTHSRHLQYFGLELGLRGSSGLQNLNLLLLLLVDLSHVVRRLMPVAEVVVNARLDVLLLEEGVNTAEHIRLMEESAM